MEIKTSFDMLKMFEKFGNHLTQRESNNYVKFRQKKWIAVDDMIKELQKYHSGLHPKCNICKLINALSETTQKSRK